MALHFYSCCRQLFFLAIVWNLLATTNTGTYAREEERRQQQKPRRLRLRRAQHQQIYQVDTDTTGYGSSSSSSGRVAMRNVQVQQSSSAALEEFGSRNLKSDKSGKSMKSSKSGKAGKADDKKRAAKKTARQAPDMETTMTMTDDMSMSMGTIAMETQDVLYLMASMSMSM